MSSASTIERQMLELINEDRQSAGMDPLRLELRLNESSEQHSEWMLETDTFSHSGAGGSNAGDRMEDAGFEFSGDWSWAENVGWQSERGEPGLSDDVADLHASLMDSPGHRANIMNPDLDVVGIGIETGDFNGWEAVMVTQNFARSGAPMEYDAAPGASSPAPEPAPEQAPEAEQAPEPNAAPVVEMDDLQLAAGSWADIGERIDYSDADGDEAARFEIRNVDGAADVMVDGQLIDATAGYVLEGGDVDSLQVRGEDAGSRATMQIRADDGEDWGDWDDFAVETDAAPDQVDAPSTTGESDDDVADAPEDRPAPTEQAAVDGPDDEALPWFRIDDRWADDLGIKFDLGRWLDAGRLANVRSGDDAEPSSQTPAIPDHDGEESSPWETFALTTGWDMVA